MIILETQPPHAPSPIREHASAPPLLPLSLTHPLLARLAAVFLLALSTSPLPSLADAPRPKTPAPSDRKVILVLGDSLAAGYGLDPSQAFPALLQKKIDVENWNFSVVNAGLSGDTSAGGLRRIDWLLKRPIDLLILELGGNDGLRGIPTEVTKENLQKIIARTRKAYPHAQIIVAGMQMPLNLGGDYVRKFGQIFPAVAEETGASLIPFLLEGVGGRADLNLPDRIHPTARGQEIVAETVWKVLEPLLRRLADNSETAASSPPPKKPAIPE